MASLLAVSGAWLLVGCGNDVESVHFNRSELVGEWVGSQGAEIVLNRNGTATFRDVPLEAISLGFDKGPKVTGTGTWRIDVVEGDDTLSLDFSSNISPTSLAHTGTEPAFHAGTKPSLFFWIGDPDSGVKYSMFHPSK